MRCRQPFVCVVVDLVAAKSKKPEFWHKTYLSPENLAIFNSILFYKLYSIYYYLARRTKPPTPPVFSLFLQNYVFGQTQQNLLKSELEKTHSLSMEEYFCNCCLEQFKPGDQGAGLRCAHLLCRKCSEKELASDPLTCPVCRTVG